MVPKPFLDNRCEVQSCTSSFASNDGDGGKMKQKVLGIFGRNHDDDNGYMVRKRIHEGYFVPLQGLVDHDFWHMYDEDICELELGCRAVLLQSIQSYRKISVANFRNFPADDNEVLKDPRFGEQLIVDCDDDVCIGDVYEVTGSTLKLRVTSPRKTTRGLDIKNKTLPGTKGICHFVTSTALAGWFCEVLSEGSMKEGNELVLVERTQPKWTLQELAKAIYGGEGDASSYTRCKPSWGRSMEELEELLALPYLGKCGWKQKLETIKRHKVERLQPIPYFIKPASSYNDSEIASVLGVYGRGHDEDEYMHRVQLESATFQPVHGVKNHWFWHSYGEYKWDKENHKAQRAVLVQTIQNYRKIMQASFECFPETDMDVILDPCFGEQLIIDCPEDICLGDVWAVTGSTARFRITSPRKPCNEIDNRNGAIYGPKGLRLFTMSRGLAGAFCSVECEGEVVKGSKFVLVERPYPKWSMSEISRAIFGGEGDPKALHRGVGSWGRPMKELHELLDNPYFADYEWKAELRTIIENQKKGTGRKLSARKGSRRNASSLSILGKLEFQNALIPLFFAFLVAMMSCLMILGSEQRKEN